MLFADYREKLNIGFNDNQKHFMLLNKIRNYIDLNLIDSIYDKQSFYNYMSMVGELATPYTTVLTLTESMKKTSSIGELISKFCAFGNTFPSDPPWGFTISKTNIIENLEQFLQELKIAYEILEDEDGYFIFPKGEKEFDDALVSAPLEWLKNYPNAHKTYCIALKQYSEGIYVRDVADNLRKALEAFLQEFLGNGKNLETNKDGICKYLGDQGVDSGISGLFQPLINAYKNINDRIAKHNDAVDKRMLEFLLYQTGILIRMVMTVKNAETGGQQ